MVVVGARAYWVHGCRISRVLDGWSCSSRTFLLLHLAFRATPVGRLSALSKQIFVLGSLVLVLSRTFGGHFLMRAFAMLGRQIVWGMNSLHLHPGLWVDKFLLFHRSDLSLQSFTFVLGAGVPFFLINEEAFVIHRLQLFRIPDVVLVDLLTRAT